MRGPITPLDARAKTLEKRRRLNPSALQPGHTGTTANTVELACEQQDRLNNLNQEEKSSTDNTSDSPKHRSPNQPANSSMPARSRL